MSGSCFRASQIRHREEEEEEKEEKEREEKEEKEQVRIVREKGWWWLDALAQDSCFLDVLEGLTKNII